MYLTKLEEERDRLVDHIIKHQIKVNHIFDMKFRAHNFMKGDKIMLLDRRRELKGAHGKFDSLWKGPFVISEVIGSNAFCLSYLDGTHLPFTYNRKNLKFLKL